MLHRWLAASSLLIAACAPAYKPVTRNVRAQDVGTDDRTRLTARFLWDDGTPEYAPPGTSPEVVTDVATLGRLDDRLCVRFEMRTGAKHDAPFGEWSPTINGEPVFPEQETSAQSVYSVDGERTVFDASYIARGLAGALTITEPTTDQYAVIHRIAWFCPTTSAPKLEFKLRRTYASLKATQGFIWTIQ
ncbi:MAG: hypothetical protein IPL61_34420 [Myxococcales bacterium]|nr:hypothetical protein [Myxococcales bacterium]